MQFEATANNLTKFHLQKFTCSYKPALEENADLSQQYILMTRDKAQDLSSQVVKYCSTSGEESNPVE